MNTKICKLNRKSYRTKNNMVRQRQQSQCCGKKERGCTLTKQPVGIVIKDYNSGYKSRIYGRES